MGSRKDEKKDTDLTQREIRRRCLKIQEGWTEEEALKRKGAITPMPYLIPDRYGWADHGGGACRKMKRSDMNLED